MRRLRGLWPLALIVQLLACQSGPERRNDRARLPGTEAKEGERALLQADLPTPPTALFVELERAHKLLEAEMPWLAGKAAGRYEALLLTTDESYKTLCREYGIDPSRPMFSSTAIDHGALPTVGACSA